MVTSGPKSSSLLSEEAPSDANLHLVSFSGNRRKFGIIGLILLEAGSLAAGESLNTTFKPHSPSPAAQKLQPSAQKTKIITNDDFDIRKKEKKYTYSTVNFKVWADSPKIARQIGKAAEKERLESPVIWFGKTIPNWPHKCEIIANCGPQFSAGGATNFTFFVDSVRDFKSTVQGNIQDLQESVIKHEVTHMIFASEFKMALPRWADEGGCTSRESLKERLKCCSHHQECIKNGHEVPLSELMAMKEYPVDTYALYGPGHSLTTFLVAQGDGGTLGRRNFINFVKDITLEPAKRDFYIQKHYGYPNCTELEKSWRHWHSAGEPGYELLPGCKQLVLKYCWSESQKPGLSSTVSN
jgi:hypothetical protein